MYYVRRQENPPPDLELYLPTEDDQRISELPYRFRVVSSCRLCKIRMLRRLLANGRQTKVLGILWNQVGHITRQQVE